MTEPDTRKRPSLYRLARARDAREWLAAYRQDSGDDVVLFLVGIRDLKQINERHGRGAGDRAIRRVGHLIERFAGKQQSEVAIIARLPGREFMLALAGQMTEADSEALANALLDSLSGNLGDADSPVYISARIGIAHAQPLETGAALHFRAGDALAKAYARKGKRLHHAPGHVASDFELQAALDAGLREAIAQDQIAILFQPQFEVVSGHLVGAEALARWHHPTLGEIGAGQLFATADRSDLREELSLLIQQKAIAAAAHWPAALSDLRLAVNLGAEELGQGYSDRLLALLRDKGFVPDRLTLELTEESLVRDIQRASAELELLREAGVRVAVDDFGTGYSSLAYLKALPIDYLKLDKGMTPDIVGTGKDRIVLRAIIAMGKALGLRIIAEGVENESELELLRAEGCDYFQGFLRAAPLDADAFEHFALLAN
jgi:diguanylate cyclase